MSIEEEFKLKPIPKANYGRPRKAFLETLRKSKPTKKEKQARKAEEKIEREKKRKEELLEKRRKIWENLYG